MRKQCLILLSLLATFLVQDGVAASAQPDPVPAEIAALEKYIVPPVGTAKTEVDRVYGSPKVQQELGPGNKGSSSDYPLYTYDLLPAPANPGFRAFLYVNYDGDKVRRAAINHICVTKNRAKPAPREELARESAGVLQDLKDIRQKYADPLKKASWNQGASTDKATGKQ